MVCCYPRFTALGQLPESSRAVSKTLLTNAADRVSGSFGGVKALAKIWSLVCKLECHETHNELLIHPFAVGFADCHECVGPAHQGTATTTTTAGYERDFDSAPNSRGVDSRVDNRK